MSQAAARFAERISRLREVMQEAGLDAYLARGDDSVRYLTGFAWGKHAYLVVTLDKVELIVRSTEHQQALETAHGVQVRCAHSKAGTEQDVVRALAGFCRVGFDAKELTVQAYRMLYEQLSGKTELVPVEDLSADLRKVKEPWEIDCIRQAAAIYDRALQTVVPLVAVGMKELEITAHLESACRLAGAESFWFPSIVASGPRTALPHALPGHRQLRRGEPLVIDMGPVVEGCPCDATRTLFWGAPDKVMRTVYEVVLRAQEASLKACREGVLCSEVDRAARRVIEEAGYQDHFHHPVGHGIAGPPLVGPDVDIPLVAGMVITVEPGIYLPGQGGVRIEDTVLITEGGYEVLHSYPKQLSVVDKV